MTEKEQQSTIQPEQTQSLHTPAEDEISFSDLLKILVRKRVLILAFTSICTLLSIFYAQSITLIYRATMAFLEPQETSLILQIGKNIPGSATFNKKGELIFETNPSAFAIFLNKIESYKLKKEVLVAGGFQEKFFGDTKIDADQAVLEIHNSTKIVKPTKTVRTAYLEIVGPKPEVMAEFLTALTKSAMDVTAKEIKGLMQFEINKLSQKIDTLRLIAKEKKEKEILLLSEALDMAKNLGVVNNSFRFYNGGNLSNDTWPRWYLYGEKALQQEIRIRKLRKNGDTILNLAETEIALKKFQDIDSFLLNIKIATISQPSIPPTKPINSFEKIKIIVAGMVLGLFISIIMAFLINAVEQLRAKETPSIST